LRGVSVYSENFIFMSVLFLSHASKDDSLARDLQAWLIGEGFDDMFVDHASIRGGDKWGDALRTAKASCRAVICLVTDHWLASDDCFGEFLAAWYQGKRIIPLLACSGAALSDTQQRHLNRVRSEDQGFDVLPAMTGNKLALDSLPEVAGLVRAGLRASGALAKVGLDPEAFEIDRRRRPSPYPGLESFGDTDADAAIFYGRTPEILRSLEDLREMRANGSRQPYIIMGASGSGKSSLLKAGILPRLRRERGWVVLRSFRPGADPLLNFAAAVIQSFESDDTQSSAGSLRDELLAAWDSRQQLLVQNPLQAYGELRDLVERTFDRLRQRADRPNSTVLVALDQAEELVHAKGQSGDVLAGYLRAMLSARSAPLQELGSTRGVLVCLTVRTDSLPALQASPRFEGLSARCNDLRPVPIYRFSAAIEEPAARYGVRIETGLVDLMIDDTPGEDALPLLAFALQRLWKQYSSETILRRLAYESLGKLSGMINDAAERALGGLRPEDDTPSTANVPALVERLAASIFVPPLAQVTDSGVAVRRVTRLARFDQRALEILDRFVAWRLLVKKPGAGPNDATIEVAHEAIFRSWPRLRNWIDREKTRLQMLRDVDDASHGWEQQGRLPTYLDHRGRRLKQARELLKIEDFAPQFGSLQRDYLNACATAQLRRRIAAGAIAVMATIIAFAGYATFDAVSMQQAMRNKSNLLVRGGYPSAAVKFAVAGAIGDFDVTGALSNDPGDDSIGETGFTLKMLLDLPDDSSVDKYVLTNDGKRLIVKSMDEVGAIWDVDNRRQIADLGATRSVANFFLTEDQTRLLTQSADNALALWDVRTGEKIGASDSKVFKSAKFVSSVSRMTTLSEDNTCTLWNLGTGTPIINIGRDHEIDWCSLSDDGTRVLSRSIRFVGTLWNAADGAKIADIGQCYTCQIASFAHRVSLIDPDGKASLFNMATGALVARLADPARLSGGSFSSNGKRLITRTVQSNLVLWNAATGDRIANVGNSNSDNYSFAPGGSQFLSRSSDGSGQLRDSERGTLLTSFPSGSIKEYKFSKRGDRLATIAFNKAGALWNSASGAKLADLGGEGEVETIVFSSDGTRLSVGSNLTTGALWDSATPRKLVDYKQARAEAGGIFSEDASRYVSLSIDNYATLWDASVGRFLTSLGGEGAASDADIARDNRRVVTNSISSTAAVLDSSIQAVREADKPGVRMQVCAMNYAFIGGFSSDQRSGEDDATVRLAPYLAGRPWHPCDWRGLLTWEGWVQEAHYWAVKIGLPWDYECGDAASGSDGRAAEYCEKPRSAPIHLPSSKPSK
jgi:WD40 repeat protein